MDGEADGEGTGDTNNTIINDTLESLPAPRQSLPPKIPPTLDASSSDLLVKEKDLEEKSPSNLEAYPHLLDELKKINPELVRVRVKFLQNQKGGLPQKPQRRNLNSKWFRKMVTFAKKRGESWLTEVLSEETDIEFLLQLLDAIYSLGAERVAMSSPVDSLVAVSRPVDMLMDALVASPSIFSRERIGELFAPI